jgi:hypothetical protein
MACTFACETQRGLGYICSIKMSRSSHSLSYRSPVLGQERPSRRLSLSPCSSDFLSGLTSSIQGNPLGFPEKLNAKQQVRGPVGLFDFAMQKQKSYKNAVQILKDSRAIFPIRSIVPRALADLFADTEQSVLPSWRDVVRYGPVAQYLSKRNMLCTRGAPSPLPARSTLSSVSAVPCRIDGSTIQKTSECDSADGPEPSPILPVVACHRVTTSEVPAMVLPVSRPSSNAPTTSPTLWTPNSMPASWSTMSMSTHVTSDILSLSRNGHTLVDLRVSEPVTINIHSGPKSCTVYAGPDVPVESGPPPTFSAGKGVCSDPAAPPAQMTTSSTLAPASGSGWLDDATSCGPLQCLYYPEDREHVHRLQALYADYEALQGEGAFAGILWAGNHNLSPPSVAVLPARIMAKATCCDVLDVGAFRSDLVTLRASMAYIVDTEEARLRSLIQGQATEVAAAFRRLNARKAGLILVEQVLHESCPSLLEIHDRLWLQPEEMEGLRGAEQSTQARRLRAGRETFRCESAEEQVGAQDQA